MAISPTEPNMHRWLSV